MLKKFSILASFVATLGVATSLAQTSQGTLYLGGGLGFSTSSEKTTFSGGNTTVNIDGDKGTNFSIVPGVGYFIIDKLSVGMDLGFNTNTFKQIDNNNSNNYDKTSTTLISFTPYARKFFMLGDSFGFTGTFGVGVGLGSSKEERKRGNTTTTSEGPKVTTLEIGIRPGIVFFPTNKVGLEANFGFIGFSSITSKEENSGITAKETTTEIGFGANSIQPTFSLGFRYYLAK
ncbi:MAG: outer membrane beta-barrel protein [Raineya sp.]|nr:outer membrane beta-barrel protein [Raineya sp.]MDW8296160.1 outer membrane beta-barrel protein [Raineya sp.]